MAVGPLRIEAQGGRERILSLQEGAPEGAPMSIGDQENGWLRCPASYGAGGAKFAYLYRLIRLVR